MVPGIHGGEVMAVCHEEVPASGSTAWGRWGGRGQANRGYRSGWELVILSEYVNILTITKAVFPL